MRIIALLTLIFLTGCAALALPTVPPNALVTATEAATAAPSPTVTPTAESVNTAELIYTAVVVQAAVNVRQEPDGAVIGAVSSGDTVTVIECDADWCLVEAEQMSGYIFRGCLSGQEDLGCTAK